jgi:hypothetical protein
VAKDNNGVTLGKVLYSDQWGLTVLTSANYIVGLNWDGTYPIAQVWYTGASCTGTAILNSGSTDPFSIYGKTLVYVGSLGSLATPTSVNSNGVSVSTASTAVQSIDNPDCQSANGNFGNGWALTAVTAASAGLPTTIAAPLSLQ